MRTSGHQRQPAARRLTTISLAVTAAIVAMTAPAAAQTVISGTETTTQMWTPGDFTVNAGAVISVSGGSGVKFPVNWRTVWRSGS